MSALHDDFADDDLPDETGDQEPEPALFDNVGDWVDNWFHHVMADRFSKEHRWCPQWWRHNAVSARLSSLHQAWETARASGDGAAMAAWWVQHADPHWRAITAPSGPLYQCTPEEHRDTKAIPVKPAPPGWFDPPPVSD